MPDTTDIEREGLEAEERLLGAFGALERAGRELRVLATLAEQSGDIVRAGLLGFASYFTERARQTAADAAAGWIVADEVAGELDRKRRDRVDDALLAARVERCGDEDA